MRTYQVLECFELQPENSVFVELIPIFPKVKLLRIHDKLASIILLILDYKKTLKVSHEVMFIGSIMLHKSLGSNFNIISVLK